MDDVGQGFADIGDMFASAFMKRDQDKKDKDFLDWLTGFTKEQQAAGQARVPDAPPPAPPIQGPQLPPGYEEPDLSVAPTPVEPAGTPSRQAGSGGVPYSEDALTNYNSLLEGRRASAQQLFQDPAQTLNILIEAKRRGAGQNVGDVLDFITEQGRASLQRQEKEKDRKARSDMDRKRMQSRTAADEARRELQRSLAEMADATRRRGQDMARRGRGGALDEDDMTSMSDSELDALEAVLSTQAGAFQAPNQGDYDSYDDFDRSEYGVDYRAYSKDKAEVERLLRTLARVRALRKPGAAGRGAGAGAGRAAPQGPVQVRTRAEYDALPPGTPYIDPNGVKGVKGR